MSGIDEKGSIPLRGAALVLLSGGMDSTACLHWALAKYQQVRAIGFDYGQPHRDAELTAAGRIARKHSVPFTIALLPELRGGLLDEVPVYTGAPGLSPAYVPGRNALFLHRALNYGARWVPLGELSLVIGCCREDAEAFPDCREEHMVDVQRSCRSGTGRDNIFVAAPYVKMPKARLLEDVGLRFGSGLIDIQESWSCYEGSGPCGKCGACVLRTAALATAGLEDLASPPVMHGGDAHRTRQLGGG